MIKNMLTKLNNENKIEVLNEYERLAEIVKTNKSTLTLTSKKKGILLLKAIDSVISDKSKEQINHLEKTAELASLFATELNLNSQNKRDLVLLARYHDIGKVNISKDILNKPSKLNDEEWKQIKNHPIYSYEILNTFPDLKEVALGALSHHERFDGTGYPAQLVGEEIPILSRVISVLDTYEVLTSGRVYRKAISQEDALAEIKRCSGTQFDPKIVNVFEKFITKTNEAEVGKTKDIEHVL